MLNDLNRLKGNQVLGTTITLLLAIIALVAIMFLHGLIISALWGWFVAPLFGFGSLSVPQAVGLELACFMISGKLLFMQQEPTLSMDEIVTRTALRPLIIFLLGAAIHFWII